MLNGNWAAIDWDELNSEKWTLETNPDRYHFFLHEMNVELSDEMNAGKMVIAGLNFPASGEDVFQKFLYRPKTPRGSLLPVCAWRYISPISVFPVAMVWLKRFSIIKDENPSE